MILRRYLLLMIWLGPLPVYSIIWFRPKCERGPHGLFDGETYFLPWDDYYHYPNQVKSWPSYMNPKMLDTFVNGTTFEVPPAYETPDFRLPERPHFPQAQYYHETGRYYRLQPTHIAAWDKARPHEQIYKVNCYCVTVYKRFTPLGMGAVLTYRHILTTALSTDMIVARYKNKKTLENILGAWYNDDMNWAWRTNNSYYMTPARIIYHTRWSGPENVNRSHPIPCVFDLALWTSTVRFWYDTTNWYWAEYMGYAGYGYITSLCDRWSNYYGGNWAPVLGEVLYLVVGCQMVMDLGRTPKPWFKYAIRYNSGSGQVFPCPKTDWEWFFCSECYGPNLRFGAEPGAAFHVITLKDSWRYIGLGGLNSFAMHLRSRNFVNYFTLLDRHPVLDWLYDAIKSRVPIAYLDFRFESHRDKSIEVRPKGGQWVSYVAKPPIEYYYEYIYPYGYSYSTQGKYEPIWWK